VEIALRHDPRPIRAAAALALALAAGCSGGPSEPTAITTVFARYGHTATALPDGRVVLIGGVDRAAPGNSKILRSEVEVFDPITQTFSEVIASSFYALAFHAAAYSDAGTPGDPSDDYILVGGGLDGDADDPSQVSSDVVKVPLGGPQPFVPVSGPTLPTAVANVEAVTLGDGRVAFVFGRTGAGDAESRITIFDPSGTTIESEVDLGALGRWNHRAVAVPLGPQGSILVTGGRRGGAIESDAFLFDVASASVVATASIGPRQLHTCTLLGNGTPATVTDDAIVVAGGLDDLEEAFDVDCVTCGGCTPCAGQGSLGDVLLLRVDAGPSITVATAGALPRPVFFHAAAANARGDAIVVAGGFATIFLDEAGGFHPGELIDSSPVRNLATFRWNPDAGRLTADGAAGMLRKRAMLAAATIPDGSVLVTGGINTDLGSNQEGEVATPR
jgi:hypothetical protein